MEIIFIIGAIQSFFQVLILLNKKKKGISDYILSVWMLMIGIHLLLFYLRVVGYDESWPYIQGIEGPLPTVHGPLLLLYIQSQRGFLEKWNWKHLLHFVPLFLLYLGYIPYFMLPLDELSALIRYFQETGDVPFLIRTNTILNLFSGVVYVIISSISLTRHRKVIGQFFSYEDKVNLVWLRNLIVGMALIWVMVLFSDAAFSGQLEIEFIDEGYLIFTTVTLFSFSMGYYGVRQGQVFTDNFEIKEREHNQSKKYSRSGLSSENSQKYLNILTEYMDENKPFLEPKLTLPQLSEKIKIHQNHLSQIINESLGLNFYEFVNSYRIQEFKDRVSRLDSDKLTLLGHAFESGFSSKSTFNEIFKKSEGSTPSEYLKNAHK